VPVVVLLATGRPWVTWWVGDPADRRLEIDVSRAPEVTEAGWHYVDLELDPIRHESDGRVEIEDWDEYDEACRNDWMSADDAKLALVVAEGCAHALRLGTEPWLQRGWHLLDRL
jgi:predicted RNA-binding protein associated with RNAse of E/G family